MNREKNDIILSLRDLKQTIVQSKWFLIGLSLLFAFVFFCHKLRKPMLYTAEGIFKSSTMTDSILPKAFELMGDQDLYFPQKNEPKFFLNSYPVIAKVVENLHLQGYLIDPAIKQSRIRQIYRNWRAERAFKKMKKHFPPSQILNGAAISLAEPFDKQNTLPISCETIQYEGSFFRHFILEFERDDFSVYENRKQIASAKLGETCSFDGGSFVLTGQSNWEKKTFHLSLIAKESAIKSLESSIRVKKDKENPHLVYVSYSHSDPQLAMRIVNATMEAFQEYLKEEGKQKIAHQLNYLKSRQKESVHDLEKMMEAHKIYLEKHLDSGGMIQLEKELDFFVTSQSKLQALLGETLGEIEEMQKRHPAYQGLSFDDLKAYFKKTPLKQDLLTLDAAKTLLLEYQCSLDHLLHQKDQYGSFQQILAQQKDPAIFSKMQFEPAIAARFAKIHTIAHNLVDDKNWSEKEKENLKEALEIETRYLIKHFADLVKGTEAEVTVVREKIHSLEETLLFLLFEQLEGVEKSFANLMAKATAFPEKWLAEQKIHLNTRLQAELMESITKMIESKNIGYHIGFSNASILKRASLPLLPNKPKILLFSLFGLFFGSFLACFIFTIQEIRKGPRASYQNLKDLDKKVVGCFAVAEKRREKNMMQALLYALPKESKHILLVSERETKIKTVLAEKLEKEKKFSFLLTSFDSFRLPEAIDSADEVIAVLHGQRLKEISHFPEKTFFICSLETASTFLSRKQLSSKIDALLKGFSSFSLFSKKPAKNS